MAEPVITSLTAPNSEAWIEFNGEPAEVFAIKPFSNGKVVGYVVSDQDATFTMHIKLAYEKRPEKDVYMRAFMNGEWLTGLWCETIQEYWFIKDKETNLYTQNFNVRTVERNKQKYELSFGKILTTEDAAKANASADYVVHVGTVMFKVADVETYQPKPRKLTKSTKKEPRTSRRQKKIHTPSVYEGKAAAMLPYQVILKPPANLTASFSEGEDEEFEEQDNEDDEDWKPDPAPGQTDTPDPTYKFLHEGENQYHTTFEFRFCSREYLELAGIVPTPPIPEGATPTPEPSVEPELDGEVTIKSEPDLELSVEPEPEPNFVERDDLKIEDVKPRLEEAIKIDSDDEKPAIAKFDTEPTPVVSYESKSTEFLENDNENVRRENAILESQLLRSKQAKLKRELLVSTKEEEIESKPDLKRVKKEEGENRKKKKQKSAVESQKNWDDVEVIKIESDMEEN